MSSNVKKVKPTDTIFKVAKLLSKYDISGAPVVSNGKVIGVISETDIMKFMKLDIHKTDVDIAAEPHVIGIVLIELLREKLTENTKLDKLKKIKVKDFMTKNVISISPKESVLDAATMLDKYQIDRLLVIEKGKLVGLVSRLDLIRALLD